MLTCNQYEGGYYTAKEASIIATLFSAVSITFTLVVLDTVGMLDKFGIYYLIVCLVGIVLRHHLPLSLPAAQQARHLSGSRQGRSRHPCPRATRTPLSTAWTSRSSASRSTRASASSSPAAPKNACSMRFGVLPTVMAVGTVALILANHTPIFAWLGLPFKPLLELLGVPEAGAVASTMIVGFTDMLTPAILIAECASDMARFIVAVVSVTQVLYLSGGRRSILRLQAALNIWELFVIFLERTIISLLIVCPIAHLMF